MAAAGIKFLALTISVYLAAAHEDQEPSEISMRCVSEGRFPHPEDCGSFVDCMYHQDEDHGLHLHARVGSCRGRAFHPTLRKCISLEKMQGCLPRAARALVADPKLDYVCEGATSEFVCADCKTLVNCVNGTAYPDVCGQGDLCATKVEKFGGGVCYPSQPPECYCDQPNQFKIDNYDETRFLFCKDKGSDPTIYQCPHDHVFDPDLSQCRNYEGLPECTSIGVFANAKNCSQYYNCIFTTNGWVQKAFSCENETEMYNEATGQCEDPCDWDTGRFTCTSEGRFRDPINCNGYFECVKTEDSQSTPTFRQTHHLCPEGYEWDPSARDAFGHCVLEGTSKLPCAPITANKCTVNRDLCHNN